MHVALNLHIQSLCIIIHGFLQIKMLFVYNIIMDSLCIGEKYVEVVGIKWIVSLITSLMSLPLMYIWT